MSDYDPPFPMVDAPCLVYPIDIVTDEMMRLNKQIPTIADDFVRRNTIDKANALGLAAQILTLYDTFRHSEALKP